MKILLADDETELLDGLYTILTQNHYSVDCCQDGMETLELLRLHSYDVILLDIMMPKVDGYEVLRCLRRENNTTPVLFLTAKGTLDDKIKGFDLGADDYLPKPFESKELLARIKALIRRSSKMTSDILSFGNTTLNLTTSKLSCRRKEETLINKEFQIMELLMTKPDHVFSTEKIMESVWSFDSLADISTVWTFISNIRRKLKSIHSDIIIKSNRGLGYSLEKKDV